MPVRSCAGCGHPEGDHKWNRSTTNPGRGVCLTAGCACREFQEVDRVIERWTVYACANCGTDWGDLPASGVRQCGRCVDRNGGKRVEVAPADQLRGAVSRIAALQENEARMQEAGDRLTAENERLRDEIAR
jgi:hypothetical protein